MVIGRNDPCKCGSGKKYKKCCFKQDKVEERMEQTLRSVDDVLAQDASIYKVWLEWRKARANADFNFLYDLIEPGSDLSNDIGDRGKFTADCSEGHARLPTGEPAAFRHLQILEGQKARLLQTLGDDDSSTSKISCECIELVKTDKGWRFAGFDTRVVLKAEDATVALSLFD